MRKYWMMVIAVLLIGSTALSQEEKVVEKLSKKEARKEKRAQKQEIFEINKAYGINLIDERNFVLQADRLSGKNNMPIPVDRGVNFVKIEGDQMIIQFGLINQLGLNGLGGTTFQGRIMDLDAGDRGEGKAYSVRTQFYTPILNGVATVNLEIRGDKARASLWSNGRVINFEGNYGTNEDIKVAQGINNRVVVAN